MLPSLRPVVLMAAGVALLAACGDREGNGLGQAGKGKQADVAAEGRLDILAWPGFARADGAAVDDGWMRSFEKATACEVHVRRVERSEQLLAVSEKDGVDLVVAGGDIALALVQSGRVQALDIARVPAYRGIAPRIANGAWHRVDGVHYGVPFQWGTMVLRYDAEAFGADLPQVADLFTGRDFDDGLPSSGRIRGYAQPIRIADAALQVASGRPDLKIEDPFALNEAQYAAALAALRQQRALSAGASDETAVLAADGPATPKLAAVHRLASGIAWSDVSMLHAKAKHPNCAMAWMQWSLLAKTQALAAASFGSFPVVAAACGKDDAVVADACMSPAYAGLSSAWFQHTPVARCGKRQCVPYSRWVRDFHALDSAAASGNEVKD